MKVLKVLCSVFLLSMLVVHAKSEDYLIVNGIPWFDNNGNIVNAHGACIVEEGGKYYLFGEWKSDETNAFPGFSCYSSDDLVNWKFENVVLRVQKDGILGPNRVGERVKVMKCPSTGEYVMYMHADDLGYMDPYIGYATCSTINGEYKLQGPLLYEGKLHVLRMKAHAILFERLLQKHKRNQLLHGSLQEQNQVLHQLRERKF